MKPRSENDDGEFEPYVQLDFVSAGDQEMEVNPYALGSIEWAIWCLKHGESYEF